MKSLTLLRQAAADPRLALMLGLGYSSGLPFLLIFSTQSAWLREAASSKADIGLMSYCALAFSFKFLWAPIIDRFDLPGLGALARAAARRGCCWRRSASRRASPASPSPAGGVAGLEHRLRRAHGFRRRDAGRHHRRLAHRRRAAGAAGDDDGGLQPRLPARDDLRRRGRALPRRLRRLAARLSRHGGADAGRHHRLPAVATARPRASRAAADIRRPRSSSRSPTSSAATPR